MPEQTLPLVNLTGVKSYCFFTKHWHSCLPPPLYFPSSLDLPVGSLRTVSHFLQVVTHSCLCQSLHPLSTSHLKCWTWEHLSCNLHWFLKSARRERGILLNRWIYKTIMAVRSHIQEQPSAALLPCRTWSGSSSEISFVIENIRDPG